MLENRYNSILYDDHSSLASVQSSFVPSTIILVPWPANGRSFWWCSTAIANSSQTKYRNSIQIKWRIMSRSDFFVCLRRQRQKSVLNEKIINHNDVEDMSSEIVESKTYSFHIELKLLRPRKATWKTQSYWTLVDIVEYVTRRQQQRPVVFRRWFDSYTYDRYSYINGPETISAQAAEAISPTFWGDVKEW